MNPNANAGSAADTSERVKTAIEELSGIFESVVGDNVKRPPDFRSGKEVRKALPELGRSNAVYRVKRDRAIQKQVLIERRKTGWQVFDLVQDNGPTDTGSRYVLTRQTRGGSVRRRQNTPSFRFQVGRCRVNECNRLLTSIVT